MSIASSSGNYKGVLFDLDGTLLDFEGPAHLALNSALTPAVHAYLGNDTQPVTWELHAKIVGQKGTLWSNSILDLLEVPSEILTPEAYLLIWHLHMEGYYPSMKLMPGALDLVRRFKGQGLKLAIATSSERKGMLSKTSFHPELMSMIDAVVTGDQVVNSKPDPEIFLRAAECIAMHPKDCMVFEDAPSGVMAGKAAGCFVVAIPDARFATWNGRDRFQRADMILSTLEEFGIE